MSIARILPAFVCVATLFALAPAAHAQTAGAPAARVIVKFREGSSLHIAAASAARTGAPIANAAALGQRIGRALVDGPSVSERAQVVHATGITSEELAARLAQEPDVEYAVPDQRKHIAVSPNDPLYPNGVPGNGPAVGQWYLRAPSSTVTSSMSVEAAWAVTTGNAAIVVADIDTGVRFEHPDLLAVGAGGNLLPGYDMISDPATANDGDGRDRDASDPGDWVTDAEISQQGGPFYHCAPTATSSSWHGTQTAGLIAARTDNGIGMASVGRTVRLLPVRALGKCGGFDSDIIAGMRWAAGLSVPGVPNNTTPARVVNMSLGGDGPCLMQYQDAVSEVIARGVVIVVSAGNSAGHAVSTPANCPGVIAVAGLRHVGTKVGFSNLGPEVTLAAPAGNCVNLAADAPCLYPILTTSNTGTTTPASSTYTDSFNTSLGTSFSAPLVAGTVALMLSAQPSLTLSQVRDILQVSARPFPPPGGTAGDGTPLLACTAPQFDSTGAPIDQLECSCTTTTCGAGMLNAGAAVLAAKAGDATAVAQEQGLWWAAPANSESGWGLNVVRQGTTIFASWFTYDTTGKGWWLVMTAPRTALNTYSGTLYKTTGPPFNATPFDPTQVVSTAVGSGILVFTDSTDGTFSYTVDGIPQAKPITRQVFGPQPVCVFGGLPDLTLATNYQDLWWAAPASSESGWGINLNHQADTIFATWFTYDVDRTPMWLVVTAQKSAPSVYSGTLYRTTGPPFNAIPFDPARVTATAVGTATFTFANGNSATFDYSVNTAAGIVHQAKTIVRQVFAAPGTACQ
jgi:serine protease